MKIASIEWKVFRLEGKASVLGNLSRGKQQNGDA